LGQIGVELKEGQEKVEGETGKVGGMKCEVKRKEARRRLREWRRKGGEEKDIGKQEWNINYCAREKEKRKREMVKRGSRGKEGGKGVEVSKQGKEKGKWSE